MALYFVNIQSLSNKIDLQVQNHSLTKQALSSRCADLDSQTGAQVANRTRNEALKEIKNRISLAQSEISKFATNNMFFVKFYSIICFGKIKKHFENFLLQKIAAWFDEYGDLLTVNPSFGSPSNLADDLKLRRSNIEETAINELDDLFRELRYKCVVEFGGIAGLIALINQIIGFFVK